MEVPPPTLDDLASLAVVDRFPFAHDGERCTNFQKIAENERPCFCGSFFQREHLDELISDSQIAAMSFDLAIAHLDIQSISTDELGRITLPVVKVQTAMQSTECVRCIELLDLQQVLKLLHETARSMLQLLHTGLNLLADQDAGLFRCEAVEQAAHRTEWSLGEFSNNRELTGGPR